MIDLGFELLIGRKRDREAVVTLLDRTHHGGEVTTKSGESKREVYRRESEPTPRKPFEIGANRA